jgi:phosphotriesterase-related protein
MHAMTVCGPIDVDQLGLTLPHEHIMFDSTCFFDAEDPEFARKDGLPKWKVDVMRAGVRLETVGELRRDPMLARDNLILDDEAVAIRELEMFREAGGQTVVDVSPAEMGRRPAAFRRIAEQTGLNIMAATGHYLAFTHPPEVASQTVDEIAQWMISEITVGIDGTDVRAGIIGELGVSEGGMHPDEEKVLRAGALAQVETGAPITVHNAIPNEKQGARVLKILELEGADPTRIIMGHMTHTVPASDYHRSIADSGALIEFDRFGAELYNDIWGGKNFCEPRDAEVAQEIAQLVSEGYADRILISHDIGFKVQLSLYGGLGFAHIPRRVLTYLRNLEVPDDASHQITVKNPARVLGNPKLERSEGSRDQAVASLGAAESRSA